MTIRIREYVPTIHPSIRIRKVAAHRPPRLMRDREDHTVLVDGGAQSAAIARFEAVIARHTRARTREPLVPHDWSARRADVIAKFKANSIETLTPHGFTEAWRPDDHAVASTELAWLQATQFRELPPEWLTLRTNGLRGESLDRLITTDDDTYSLKDLIGDGYIPITEMSHQHELLGGMRRIEAFLQAEDEKDWYATPPRRYHAVVDGEMRAGFVPINRGINEDIRDRHIAAASRHLPSHDDIRWAMRHRDANRTVTRDRSGKALVTYAPGTFSERAAAGDKEWYALLDDIEAERATTDTDYEVALDENGNVLIEADVYAPSTPCPNEHCEERGDDCVVCQGTKRVSHTLGLDAEADWPPPGWLREPMAFLREGRPRPVAFHPDDPDGYADPSRRVQV